MTKRNNWEPDWLRKWNPAAIEPPREPTPEGIEQQKLIDAAVDAICAPSESQIAIDETATKIIGNLQKKP